jgi:hypothetical protein
MIYALYSAWFYPTVMAPLELRRVQEYTDRELDVKAAHTSTKPIAFRYGDVEMTEFFERVSLLSQAKPQEMSVMDKSNGQCTYRVFRF